MIKAIILTADSGLRLPNLAKTTLSSLLPIKGSPAIEYIVDRLQLLDEVDEIDIVVNSRFHSQFKDWSANYASSIPIKIIDNGTFNHKDSRGAVKDLYLSIDNGQQDKDILVVGADNIFSFDLNEFIDFAKSQYPHNLIGVYDLNGKLKPKKFGVVKVDAGNNVIDFWEKPDSLNGSRLISTCLYFFPKEKLHLIKKYIEEESGSHYPGDYIKWLTQRERVKAYKFEGLWFDISDIDSYTEAVFTF